jgi:hypothetical protein
VIDKLVVRRCSVLAVYLRVPRQDELDDDDGGLYGDAGGSPDYIRFGSTIPS